MMNRALLIVGALLVLLCGFGLGWVGHSLVTPKCPEVVGVKRETVTPVIPDGKTTGVVGNVKVKPVIKGNIPAKIKNNPANGVSVGGQHTDTPDVEIYPHTVSIDSAGVVNIPITEKEYKTEDYKAVVRGWRPELVSMELYPKTTIVQKRPRWSLTVGPGCTYTSDGEFKPGINATLGFVIWSK